jgi:tRNA U34 2-thiouridine synthase MnmA/TrmU
VILNEPLTAVANGQAAAFFDGDLLVGGGIIDGAQ